MRKSQSKKIDQRRGQGWQANIKIRNGKCKAKYVSFNDKAIGGSGGVATLVLKPGTRCRCAISFTLRPLCLAEKGPPVPIQ
jgi:hypothetical protein